jgi:hypothetical protein
MHSPFDDMHCAFSACILLFKHTFYFFGIIENAMLACWLTYTYVVFGQEKWIFQVRNWGGFVRGQNSYRSSKYLKKLLKVSYNSKNIPAKNFRFLIQMLKLDKIFALYSYLETFKVMNSKTFLRKP